MKLQFNSKYAIFIFLLGIISIILLVKQTNIKESFNRMIVPYPKDAVINYNDVNSQEYTHTVNLPINDPVSCRNFCGPNAKCVLTGEQCSADIDCQGCKPIEKPRSECITKDVKPYESSGKLTQNIGLHYSPLINENNRDYDYLSDEMKTIVKPYMGKDMWTKSFNEGLKLYNKKREAADKYGYKLDFGYTDANAPKYPMSISATGEFYETTPPSSNTIL